MIDKRFFTDLEELLKEYADEGSRFRNTYVLGNEHPPEAFIILALRCIDFRGEGNLRINIKRDTGSRPLMEEEVGIDFFPRSVNVYFGRYKGSMINQKMKQYLLSLQSEKNLNKLDYTDEWIALGFCKHCSKKAQITHPDYEHTRICKACLKLRDMFLVVVQ